MATKDFIVDPATIRSDLVIADLEAIRRTNPQRYEMEMLSAVSLLDTELGIAVGYKDVRDSDFWVRGHMPGRPLMPGVLMCEVAAQLCSFLAHALHLVDGGVVGFGGLESVRFRGPVVPGDRLFMVVRKARAKVGRMIVCDFQGIVSSSIVCDGQVIGIRLPMD